MLLWLMLGPDEGNRPEGKASLSWNLMKGMSRGPVWPNRPDEENVPRVCLAMLRPDEGNVLRASLAKLGPDE